VLADVTTADVTTADELLRVEHVDDGGQVDQVEHLATVDGDPLGTSPPGSAGVGGDHERGDVHTQAYGAQSKFAAPGVPSIPSEP